MQLELFDTKGMTESFTEKLVQVRRELFWFLLLDNFCAVPSVNNQVRLSRASHVPVSYMDAIIGKCFEVYFMYLFCKHGKKECPFCGKAEGVLFCGLVKSGENEIDKLVKCAKIPKKPRKMIKRGKSKLPWYGAFYVFC